MAISEARAKIIAKIEAKILDKINDAQTNGGTFLQQVPTVTIGGQPVAARIGGSLGSLGGALSQVTSIVQAAGDIASLVQNPMALVELAVSDAINIVDSKLGDISGKLTGGQLSNITAAISDISSKLNDLQAHTSNLSGLSSSISDTTPDFKKIQNVGETLRGLGSDTTPGFVANTASALKSQNEINDVKDTLNIVVASKMNEILTLDETSLAGQTAIAALVTDINTLLNNQANVMETIVITDTNNFNESSNNLTASTDVVELVDQYNDANSVTYSLFVDLGVAKRSTLSSFDAAISEVKIE